MKSNKESNYVLYFDLLNIFACFAVVMLHMSAAPSSFAYTFNWKVSMFFEAAFYWAVPVFLMLTGANLINYRKRYSTSCFLSKRLGKTFIPFLFWSLVAIVWRIKYLKTLSFYDVNSAKKLIDSIFNAKPMSIYWFFPLLFSVYFAIPAISLIPENKRLGRKGIYWYLYIYSFVTISALPLVCSLLKINWNASLTNPMMSGHFALVILGYMLANTDIKKRDRFIIYGIGIIGFLMYFVLTAKYSFRAGNFDTTFKGYTNMPSMMMSPAVFVLFKYIKWNNIFNNKSVKYIKLISSASFGVYLVHYFVIQFIKKNWDFNIRSLAWKTLGSLSVYCISLIIVLAFKKIPGLKKLVP